LTRYAASVDSNRKPGLRQDGGLVQPRRFKVCSTAAACWRSLASTSLRWPDTGSGPDRASPGLCTRGASCSRATPAGSSPRSGSPCRSAGCRPACCLAGRKTSAHRSRGSIFCAPDPALFHCANDTVQCEQLRALRQGGLHRNDSRFRVSSRNCSGSGTGRCTCGTAPRCDEFCFYRRRLRASLSSSSTIFGQLRRAFEHVGLGSLSHP